MMKRLFQMAFVLSGVVLLSACVEDREREVRGQLDYELVTKTFSVPRENLDGVIDVFTDISFSNVTLNEAVGYSYMNALRLYGAKMYVAGPLRAGDRFVNLRVHVDGVGSFAFSEDVVIPRDMNSSSANYVVMDTSNSAFLGFMQNLVQAINYRRYGRIAVTGQLLNRYGEWVNNQEVIFGFETDVIAYVD